MMKIKLQFSHVSHIQALYRRTSRRTTCRRWMEYRIYEKGHNIKFWWLTQLISCHASHTWHFRLDTVISCFVYMNSLLLLGRHNMSELRLRLDEVSWQQQWQRLLRLNETAWTIFHFPLEQIMQNDNNLSTCRDGEVESWKFLIFVNMTIFTLLSLKLKFHHTINSPRKSFPSFPSDTEERKFDFLITIGCSHSANIFAHHQNWIQLSFSDFQSFAIFSLSYLFCTPWGWCRQHRLSASLHDRSHWMKRKFFSPMQMSRPR